MTNTLTWGFKPPQLPQVNSNLLSTISFCMLCVMLFTAGAVTVHAVCESEYNDLQWARGLYGAAAIALAAAEVALAAAIYAAAVGSIFNPTLLLAVASAAIAVDLAAISLVAAGRHLIEKERAYDECLNRNLGGTVDSGGCSGSSSG